MSYKVGYFSFFLKLIRLMKFTPLIIATIYFLIPKFLLTLSFKDTNR